MLVCIFAGYSMVVSIHHAFWHKCIGTRFPRWLVARCLSLLDRRDRLTIQRYPGRICIRGILAWAGRCSANLGQDTSPPLCSLLVLRCRLLSSCRDRFNLPDLELAGHFLPYDRPWVRLIVATTVLPSSISVPSMIPYPLKSKTTAYQILFFFKSLTRESLHLLFEFWTLDSTELIGDRKIVIGD